jgi:hypothetical protein
MQVRFSGVEHPSAKDWKASIEDNQATFCASYDPDRQYMKADTSACGDVTAEMIRRSADTGLVVALAEATIHAG